MTSSAARGTFSSPSMSGVAAAERRNAGHRSGAASARWTPAEPDVIGRYRDAPIYGSLAFKGMRYEFAGVVPPTYPRRIDENELYLEPGLTISPRRNPPEKPPRRRGSVPSARVRIASDDPHVDDESSPESSRPLPSNPASGSSADARSGDAASLP